ncbi:MAG TPA: glycoside hydrolase family 3 C-terminal domain-containing protein [Candidatus Acidoferrales bacterium]|nr:glycoside hydrolase family 3 C-terminal domain-containing protein [Candidatus Acidoferrales bacterium]
MKSHTNQKLFRHFFFFMILTGTLTSSVAQSSDETHPWMNPSLSPDDRAAMVVKEMTLDEKITLLHGTGQKKLSPVSPQAAQSNGGAGYVVGIPRLGIPAIQMADAAYGVTKSGENGRYSTALPADLGAAASWDLDAAYEYGALIGRELRAQGYNMTLGGGMNLTREPRNGRTFEYMGEDPLLAGKMVGAVMRGEQAQHVIGDLKHYAVNDQESGRNAVNVNIDQRAARESDLLAFEVALQDSNAAAVMCSYNRVNGDFACENKYLLNEVLKKDWGFKGFVVSDWTATHSTAKASAAGLDQEEPGFVFYGADLKKAVEAGKVPMAEVDDHVRRVLWAMFASGVIDDPPQKGVVEVGRGLEIAQRIEEQSAVLLKNDGQLPLDPAGIRSIAVIGPHADVGMISGAGSAQVDPPGGNAIMPPGQGQTHWQDKIWFPTSPLKAIRAKVPAAQVQFASGTDAAAAAALAKSAEVAIIFAYQWETEDIDLADLSLPEHQDDLIAKVAAANPHTVVVLETGSPVTMPWADQAGAILEAWYGGSRGAEAVVNILFGDVNPSAKLPVTFPRSEADLPHPTIVKPGPESVANFDVPDGWKRVAAGLPAFQVTYDEGTKVGYKWYDAENKTVLFPFGYGLSYTTYSYSNLKVTPGKNPRVSFTVTNTGKRSGAEIAEVYASLPAAAAEPPKQLVGWSKIKLDAGESKEVTIEVDRKYLSIFSVEQNGWQLVPGEYTFLVGGSSRDLPLKETVSLN